MDPPKTRLAMAPSLLPSRVSVGRSVGLDYLKHSLPVGLAQLIVAVTFDGNESGRQRSFDRMHTHRLR